MFDFPLVSDTWCGEHAALAMASTAPSARKSGPNTPDADLDLDGVGLSHVAAMQRARILAAMVAVACERGAADASIAHVVARAGVSRRTFYELFSDREDCLQAALEHALAQASAPVLDAYAGERTWREKLRAGLVALLGFLEEEPALARLLIVESSMAGRAPRERRARVIDRLTAAVDDGRSHVRQGNEPPALTAEGLVGAVLSILHARLTRAYPGRLLDLCNPLMSMLVLPYLGTAAARRELGRPLPERTRPDRPPARVVGARASGRLPIRMTYRTMRVLEAVGSATGASNREIGNVAGIADQGQISKLLARLERVGLVENACDSRLRGQPNSWRLTMRGSEVTMGLGRQMGRQFQRKPEPAI